MEPARPSKGPHHPWKTESSWDSEEWGRPIKTVCSNRKVEESPDCNMAPKPLPRGDEAVSTPAQAVKVEPPNNQEQDGINEVPDFQPKKKAIWKLLGNTSYPLVPKWTSCQEDSQRVYSFPGYRKQNIKTYHGWKTRNEESSAALGPTSDFCKLKKDLHTKPKAVFSPMLNSLLTIKNPVSEPIQEITQKPVFNHCTIESIMSLKDDPEKAPTMPSVQGSSSPTSGKLRGPYRTKVNPNVNHSTDNSKSASHPSSSHEAELNSFAAQVNSSAPRSEENAPPSQSENSSDQKLTSESRFLLIDDQGVPYTMMKRERENKPKDESAAMADEKPPVPKKLHYCLVCYRTFLYLSDLERHSITHSEHKPFECKACGKTFKRSSHLQRHKHIHTGERPFLCPICQKGFRESGELHRHQRVHTGEKPFQCELCHLLFTERNTLRRHIRRKHTFDNLFKQDGYNLSDWGEAFTETADDEEEDKKVSSDQALSDNNQKSPSTSTPNSSSSIN